MKEKFARWELLLFQYVKRDWKKMIVWIVALGFFSAGFIPAFQEIAKGQGAIGMYETLQNPAMISMVGPTPVETATNYTLGAMYAHEMLLFCGLFAMIISVLHVIGHTRKEEDLGLTELVRSFQVGRQANSLAVMMEVLFINVVLSLFIAVMLISFDAPTITVTGSFIFGASIGIAGMIGAVIALVLAQVMPNSSSSTGSTLGIIGLLYIIRAGTDVSNDALSIFNPLGWTYLTYPFTSNDWLPLVYALIFCMVMVVVAFILEGARDMGAGYIPQREGRATAKKSLLSVRGLFMKINQGTIISWFCAFIIMGAAYGSIYGDMQKFLESNDLMKQMFSSTGISMEASFTSTIMMVMISLVAILPIVIVNKLFVEESRLYLSQIFATKVSRSQLYWTTIGLAVLTSIVGVLLAAGGLGGTAIMVMGENSGLSLSDFIIAGYNLLPTVLFVTGLAALVLGWMPKLGKFVYLYLIYSFMLNYFEGILDLPKWFSKTAIQNWPAQMPMEDFDGTVFITVTMVSIIFMIIGYLGYSRRDMIEGA